MRNCILIVASFCVMASAQISADSTDFKHPIGHTEIFNKSTTHIPVSELTKSGPNTYWNFTGIGYEKRDTTWIVDTITNLEGLQIEDYNYVVYSPEHNQYNYFLITSQGLYWKALVVHDKVKSDSIGSYFLFNSSSPYLSFPLETSNSFLCTLNTTGGYKTINDPAEWRDKYAANVNGWGKVRISLGEFDALKITHKTVSAQWQSRGDSVFYLIVINSWVSKGFGTLASSTASVKVLNRSDTVGKTLNYETFKVLDMVCLRNQLGLQLPKNKELQRSFDVFPNPASNASSIVIRGIQGRNYQLELVDIEGRLINRIQQHGARINLGNLSYPGRPVSPGNYLLNISEDPNKISATIKLIVMNP